MRILTLSNSPLDERQGSGYVILGFTEGLRRRGHHVDLLDPRDIEWPSPGRRAIRYRQIAGMYLAASPARASHYDVVEFYGGEACLAIRRLSNRRSRPVLVSHSNGLEPQAQRRLQLVAAPRRFFQRDLSRLSAIGFKRADAVVTVSSYERDFALAEGYQKPERVLALDNPLPEEFLSQPVDGEREPNVVVCGSWIERKGTKLICAALPGFLEEFPGWRLTLVGVGEGFDVQKHFPRSITSRIEVIPHAERSTELRRILLRSSIALQASIYESFGLSTAEAMSCGCAVVATPVGFAAGLKDREELILLPDPPTTDALRTALRLVAIDPPLRQRLREGAWCAVQGLRWGPTIERYEQFLEALVSERSA